jgi:hypothetical protein
MKDANDIPSITDSISEFTSCESTSASTSPSSFSEENNEPDDLERDIKNPKIKFSLNKVDSDDSVIFAEENDSQSIKQISTLQRKKQKLNNVKSKIAEKKDVQKTKSKQIHLDQETNEDNEDEEEEDDETRENSNSTIYHIYIQVIISYITVKSIVTL